MCPLRFILVFFSAILAGFFAWRSIRTSPDALDSSVSDDPLENKSTPSKEIKQKTNFKLMMQNVFWVFVDMASGRYLWRNLKGLNKNEDKIKSS